MTGGAEESLSDNSIILNNQVSDSISSTYFDHSSFLDARNEERNVLPFFYDTFDTNGAEYITPSSLSDEERRLLAQEGVALAPNSNLPLTQEEERTLKLVRRKIRNKVSAKTSRKRKRVYIDNLEKRVKHCSIQNHSLMERVGHLERQNSSLMEELVRLRSGMMLPSITGPGSGFVSNAAVAPSRRNVGMTPYTMVLMMSFALLMILNIDPLNNWNQLPTTGEHTGRAYSSFEQSSALFSAHSSPGLQEPDQCPAGHPFLSYFFQMTLNRNHLRRGDAGNQNSLLLQETELFLESQDAEHVRERNTSEFLACHFMMMQHGEAEEYINNNYRKF